METRYWFSKNLRLVVHRMCEPSGGMPFRITYPDGTPYPDAGRLIKSCPRFWRHCITKDRFDGRVAASDYARAVRAVCF